MTKQTRVLCAAALAVLAACADNQAGNEILSPQFAKPAAPSDPVSSWLIPHAATGLAFSSDGAFAAGGYSVYENGKCGVTSKIFATIAASNSGDAIMQTDNPSNRDRKCSSY